MKTKCDLIILLPIYQSRHTHLKPGPHQVPLVWVAGVVEGHRPLGSAEDNVLRVPQHMWVGGQQVSRVGPLVCPSGSPQPGPGGTQEVVAFQLSDLTPVLQSHLFCHLRSGRVSSGHVGLVGLLCNNDNH